MSLHDTVKEMRELLGSLSIDLEKAVNGNKAASQRVRTGTIKLEKSAKKYRKESIRAEKATVGKKKTQSKKTSTTKKNVKTTKIKAKPKAKMIHVNPMVKCKTAKIPMKTR